MIGKGIPCSELRETPPCHTFRINSLEGIPDPNGAGDISASNVKSAGGEAGDGSLSGVADVLLARGRVVDGADENRFAGLTSTQSASQSVSHDGARWNTLEVLNILQRYIYIYIYI